MNQTPFSSWKNPSLDMDFESLKQELFMLFKSPNPLAIYMKSQDIKEKFSLFLNALSEKISSGFDLNEDSQSFIYGVYKNANYQNIWMYNLENYLRESKNFDLLSYLNFVFLLNPQKSVFAKALLKMYQWEPKEDIETYLLTYAPKISYKSVEKVFTDFQIKNMMFTINLRFDFIEHFIEKIALSLDSETSTRFLDFFVLKIDKRNVDFSAFSKILLKIISSYATNGKAKTMHATLATPFFAKRKKVVDEFLNNYHTIRWDFYASVSATLEGLPITERVLFWQYVKTRMIDLYFPEIKLLFYEFSSNEFLDKDTFWKLKGTIQLPEMLSEEAQYMYRDYLELNDLKNLILELQDNLFSFFLLPLIYYTMSEKITFPKKDLYKMKYVLLFIFSANYSEYKKIYMFFNQLEIFLNYGKHSNVLWKIQVSFSLFILVFLSLIFSYFYLPIWVFIGIFMLSTIKFYEIAYPNKYYNQKWNFGLKFFSILFLCISSYFWFQNFEKIKKDSTEIVQKIEFLWTLQTSTTIEWGYKYIKASLFDIK